MGGFGYQEFSKIFFKKNFGPQKPLPHSGAAQGKFQEAYKAREAEKDEEIKKYKDELKELQDAANKMKTAVGMAEKGTAALKNALNMCQDTLKDAL